MLQQVSVSSVQLLPCFDPRVSPRNMLIVATKTKTTKTTKTAKTAVTAENAENADTDTGATDRTVTGSDRSDGSADSWIEAINDEVARNMNTD